MERPRFPLICPIGRSTGHPRSTAGCIHIFAVVARGGSGKRRHCGGVGGGILYICPLRAADVRAAAGEGALRRREKASRTTAWKGSFPRLIPRARQRSRNVVSDGLRECRRGEGLQCGDGR